MKRYHILITIMVLAMAMTSCLKEPLVNDDFKLGSNDFAFSIGDVTTKAVTADEFVPAQGFKLGESGYYLEETVENMDAPATKGTPIYTSNIDSKYNTINVVGYNGTTPCVEDTPFTFETAINGRKVYSHPLLNYFWPDDWDQELYFFLRAPAEYIDANTEDLSYVTTETGLGDITFDYTSPTKGEDQKDMLFTFRTLTRNEYFDESDKYYENGAPVTFYHALTGVKFRNGHANNNPTKTIITKVEISGLRSKGTCTVSPGTEDSNGNVTTKSSDVVEWEGLDDATSFTQEFTNQAWSATGGVDGTVTYTSGENNKFGDSWYAAGNDANNPTNTHNLNDDDGSLTFWFIPQEIDDDVTLKVTFRVKTEDTPNGTEITHTIQLGEILNKDRTDNVEWKAGELRTYTLKPLDVDVKIVDQMQGLKKSNLHVTNTGNVDEYVRIMVIGNWYGWMPGTTAEQMNPESSSYVEPDIMVGYTTDGTTGDNTMVTPWFREDAVYGQYFDDTFPLGRPAAGRTDWVRGTGSYFYYTQKIGPGAEVGTTESGTNPLFVSYELPADKIPTIYVPVTDSNVRLPALGVHLKMEIVIQAIGTTYIGEDGLSHEYADCWAAWTAAVGKTITIKN